MKEFIIRISFILIVVLLYFAGNKITVATSSDIEFKSILPFISLVFWDYYLRFFEKFLFKLRVVEKTLLVLDNKSTGVKAELYLSYNGNSTVNFRFGSIKVKGAKGATRIKHGHDEYHSIGDFNQSFKKDSGAECITVEFIFDDHSNPIKTIFSRHLFRHSMEITYFNNGKRRVLRKTFMDIRKGA